MSNPDRRSASPLGRLIDRLASFELSVLILFFLFVVTWRGTIAQADLGLFQSQKKYFDSWYWAEPLFWRLALPMPGGVLLMSLLFVNLLAGGIVRLKRTWSRLGILVTHLGIVLMLAAGLVKFVWSDEGALAFYEGETGSEFVSYHHSEIVVEELESDGRVRQWVVPDERFVDAQRGRTATFRHDGLPFELVVSDFAPNARPEPASASIALAASVVDGFSLRRLPLGIESEADFAGCYATVRGADGREQRGLLWARELHPWTVDVGERSFAVTMRRRTWPLPFQIRLEKFHHDYHPGTSMARAYSSDVVVTAPGQPPTPVRIEMNDPLRRDGYVLFQSDWGPKNEANPRRLYSVLAVVRNPSDHWPLWSCIVIAIGLTLHFGRMLVRYVRSETAR